jgi:hypothetical protein
MVVEPFTSAAIVDSLKGLFVPDRQISEQYEKGLMGRDSGGMNWYMDQNIVSQTFGAYTGATAGTLNVNTTGGFSGSLATGWASTSTITVNVVTTNVALNQGDTFTITGVNAANPQNRQAYGSNRLRNFVVMANVTGTAGSTMSVTVSPAIITGGQFQNVVVASTSATAAITPFSIGTSAVGTVSPQNILYHRNFGTLAVADLELPEGVHFAGRASDREIGLSIRVVRQYTINNDAIPTRLDVLYGWAPLYPELACRVAA